MSLTGWKFESSPGQNNKQTPNTGVFCLLRRCDIIHLDVNCLLLKFAIILLNWRENMSDAAQTFSEAYDLIEQGNLIAARQLLDNVRAENENNPDFWWVYAHAVEDAQAGRDALQRVQHLQPDYPGIHNLMQQAGISTARPTVQTLRPPQSLPDLPKTQGFDDEFSDMDEDFVLDEPVQNDTQRNLLLGVAAVVVLLVLAGLFIPSLLGGDEVSSTATPIAQPVTTLGTLEIIDTTEDATEAIDEATATEEEAVETDAATPTEEEVEPTDEPTATEEEVEPTSETEPTEDVTEATEDIASDDAFAELAAQLTDYEVPVDGVAVGETLLGNTFLVTTCSPPGPIATQSILSIADTLKAETLADDIEAVGFRIANCEDNTAVRIIGVSRSDFDAFAAGSITAQQLQGLLRPIG
jgi:hypothetical protein